MNQKAYRVIFSNGAERDVYAFCSKEAVIRAQNIQLDAAMPYDKYTVKCLDDENLSNLLLRSA